MPRSWMVAITFKVSESYLDSFKLITIWLTHPYAFRAQPNTTKSTPIAPAKDSAMILENTADRIICKILLYQKKVSFKLLWNM